MPTATTGFIARSRCERAVVEAAAVAEPVAVRVEGEQRHQHDVGLEHRACRAAARRCPSGRAHRVARRPGAEQRAACPCPASPAAQADSPSPASRASSGAGSISSRMAEKPETIAPGGRLKKAKPMRGEPLTGRRAVARDRPRHGGRAPGFFLPVFRPHSSAKERKMPRWPSKRMIPRGPYESRWAPCVRGHGPGQGQLPCGSYRPRGTYVLLTHPAARANVDQRA